MQDLPPSLDTFNDTCIANQAQQQTSHNGEKIQQIVNQAKVRGPAPPASGPDSVLRQPSLCSPEHSPVRPGLRCRNLQNKSPAVPRQLVHEAWIAFQLQQEGRRPDMCLG